MSVFDRLHPALQHHVVNTLGWSSLRPFQEECLGPVLDGEHLLVLAPTAGGKTEAAFLPLLSRLLSEHWSGLSVLYVCPLRALLNNLHTRLEHYSNLVGRRVGLWHGDVSQTARRRMLAEPPDCLLTTPESLEVLLTSPHTDEKGFFSGLRAVVVDEVHAFAGDDRGWHLLAVLERLSRLAGRELQRVGLSATVGNAPELLAWLAGSCRGPSRVIAPSAPSTSGSVTVDSVGSLDNSATVISRMHRGEKRLVFCDSRSRVEQLASKLRDRDVETYVSHSSLGLDERRRAEEAFAVGSDCVIVATSTLELGIDVGDLDRVIQIDAPGTVSSFLQRLGRTGRRAGTERSCLFLATSTPALLRAGGLVQLWRDGFVEPVEPPPHPYHLLAQQLMALALQERGLGAETWREWISGMPGFAGMDGEAVAAVVRHMLEVGILSSDQGLLWLGRTGEETFGRRNFLELFSVFTSEPLFTVRHGRTDLGQVHQISLTMREDQRPVLLLAGRSWLVNHVDWGRRVAWVEPSTLRGRSRWLGTGQPLRYELCQAVRRLLCGEDTPGHFSRRASAELDTVRAEFSWCENGSTAFVVDDEGKAKWWTFGGLLANAALAERLTRDGLRAGQADNFGIPVEAVAPGTTVEQVLSGLRGTNPDDVVTPVADGAVDDLKFSQCLPRALATRMLQRRMTDAGAIRSVLSERVEFVRSS